MRFFLAVSFVFSEKRIGEGGKLCVYAIDFMLWLCTTGNIGKTKETVPYYVLQLQCEFTVKRGV